MKQKVVLIVSVVIGLLAALLTRSYLNSQDQKYQKMTKDFYDKHQKIEVMAVNKNLPSGTVLTREDLGAVSEIKSAVLGQAINAKDYMVLLGRKTVRPLEREQIIRWTDIEGGGPDSKGLSGDIRKEMRGYSVDVSGAASLSGMVQPNDHVDVLGTYTFPSKTVPGEMELVTLTIMQDVLVLATGKETAKSRLFANNAAASAYNTVTLEVSPREVEMLDFTKQIKGRISLSLRNPDDVYFESTLPRVNFDKIQSEIENLNKIRQEKFLRKRTVN